MSKRTVAFLWWPILIAALSFNPERTSAQDNKSEGLPKLSPKPSTQPIKPSLVTPDSEPGTELLSVAWLQPTPRHQYDPASLNKKKDVLLGWYTSTHYPCLITKDGVIRLSMKNKELEDCQIEVRGSFYRRWIFAVDLYRPIKGDAKGTFVKTDKIKWVQICSRCGEIPSGEVIILPCSICREHPGKVTHVDVCDGPCHTKCGVGVEWIPLLAVDNADARIQAQSKLFRYYANKQNAGWPAGNEVITLTAPQRIGASAACFFHKTQSVPLSVSFDYSNDGPHTSFSEGLSLIIGADEAVYKKSPPTAFGSMGYRPDAGGFALVFYKLYAGRTYRRVGLERNGKWLANEDIEIPAEAGWQSARVEITEDSIGVFLDGKTVLWWTGKTVSGAQAIAVGSASGVVTNSQKIKGFKVESLKKPTQPDPSFLKAREDMESPSF